LKILILECALLVQVEGDSQSCCGSGHDGHDSVDVVSSLGVGGVSGSGGLDLGVGDHDVVNNEGLFLGFDNLVSGQSADLFVFQEVGDPRTDGLIHAVQLQTIAVLGGEVVQDQVFHVAVQVQAILGSHGGDVQSLNGGVEVVVQIDLQVNLVVVQLALGDLDMDTNSFAGVNNIGAIVVLLNTAVLGVVVECVMQLVFSIKSVHDGSDGESGIVAIDGSGVVIIANIDVSVSLSSRSFGVARIGGTSGAGGTGVGGTENGVDVDRLFQIREVKVQQGIFLTVAFSLPCDDVLANDLASDGITVILSDLAVGQVAGVIVTSNETTGLLVQDNVNPNLGVIVFVLGIVFVLSIVIGSVISNRSLCSGETHILIDGNGRTILDGPGGIDLVVPTNDVVVNGQVQTLAPQQFCVQGNRRTLFNLIACFADIGQFQIDIAVLSFGNNRCGSLQLELNILTSRRNGIASNGSVVYIDIVQGEMSVLGIDLSEELDNIFGTVNGQRILALEGIIDIQSVRNSTSAVAAA